MSYYMGVILPDLSNNEFISINKKFDIHLQKEISPSLASVLNNGECFYSCFQSGLGVENGFSSYDSCRHIEATKNNIEEQADSFKEMFFSDIYPLIEKRQNDAEQWVAMIHFCFDFFRIQKMGIVMYWCSNGIEECSFSKFPCDTTELDKIDRNTIMRFKPDVIHYIIKNPIISKRHNCS